MVKRKRRRRTSLITKGINLGVLLLAFKRPIELLLAGNTNLLAEEASMGFAAGVPKFELNKALNFYGPMVAAVILKKAISMVRRTARI